MDSTERNARVFLHDCPECGEPMLSIPDEPEWLRCSQCGVEYFKQDVEDGVGRAEEYEEFDEEDDTGTWDSYGRHRTKLRESDE